MYIHTHTFAGLTFCAADPLVDVQSVVASRATCTYIQAHTIVQPQRLRIDQATRLKIPYFALPGLCTRALICTHIVIIYFLPQHSQKNNYKMWGSETEIGRGEEDV